MGQAGCKGGRRDGSGDGRAVGGGAKARAQRVAIAVVVDGTGSGAVPCAAVPEAGRDGVVTNVMIRRHVNI